MLEQIFIKQSGRSEIRHAPGLQREQALPAADGAGEHGFPCFLPAPPEQGLGNWHSEVCLGFHLSPGDPPGHLTRSQSVLFIDDSRINTFQAER